MLNDQEKFIQANSPDGGFLQSSEWQKFQAAVGRKTHNISADGFWANIVEHTLPVVGKYFYVPRGPVMPIFNFQFSISKQFSNLNDKISKQIQELIDLAKKENAGWVRVEPGTGDILEIIKAWTSDVQMHSGHPMSLKIVKAPHDMQPKEVFIIDISKTEEELLAEMKSKTRYNVRLAEKKGVMVKEISNDKLQIANEASALTRKDDCSSTRGGQNPNDKNESEKYISEFLRLVKVTAKRDGITTHPESYYRKMLETIPNDILKLYVAEYEGRVIAANLVLFYGETCTYMHGASDDTERNVMAPYLLQWTQIKDAKSAGCIKYDFGGVKMLQPIRPATTPPQPSPEYRGGGSTKWAGITKFKTGFSPNTVATRFPGSYDIIINPRMYWLYRMIQKVKGWVK